jgi:ABC-2 type transport system permease protein
MKKLLLVLRHELRTTLGRPSFLFFAFGVPVLAMLIFGVVTLVRGDEAEETAVEEEYTLEVEGYVDHSGLISVLPEGMPDDHLLAFDGEEEAQQALSAGAIEAYYLIPADYVDEGRVYYVYPESRSLTDDGQKWVIQRTLLTNLLEGDMELMERVWNPIALEAVNIAPQPRADAYGEEDCSSPGNACRSNQLVRLLPSAMAVLFYITFAVVSNLLLRSVSTEKENQTIEILMLSVSPEQMLSGKIIGLGVAGLLQISAWAGTIYALMSLGGSTLALPDEFSFPVSILLWGVAFFLLGFVIYASQMAGLGALAPNMKEIGQTTMIVLAPLMVGYIIAVVAPLASATHSALSVALSIFPLTSPVVMMMRLTEGGVPPWQLWLSLGLLLVSAYGIVRICAALFRAQHLLSGESFSLGRYYRALVNR